MYKLICVEKEQADDSFNIDDSFVELSGAVYKLISPQGSWYVREGTWFRREDNGELEPDWSLTWIYKDKDYPEEYTYYEQDPMSTAVYNFMQQFKEY